MQLIALRPRRRRMELAEAPHGVDFEQSIGGTRFPGTCAGNRFFVACLPDLPILSILALLSDTFSGEGRATRPVSCLIGDIAGLPSLSTTRRSGQQDGPALRTVCIYSGFDR